MEKLLEALKRIKPNVDWINCKTLVDDGMLDSIDIISIITEIEKEYSIKISPDDIDPDNFQSVASIYRMIEYIESKQ